MAKLLVPMDIQAKVLDAELAVPALDAEPFADAAVLEPGVHLHWALPDALTRARTLTPDDGDQAVIFPAVPDRWLVLRFDPKAPSSGRPPIQPVSPVRPRRPRVFQPVRRPRRFGAVAPRRAAVLQPMRVQPRAAIGRPGPGRTPPPTRPGRNTRRSWHGWVVDSRLGIITPLEDWEPATPAGGLVHTALGLLPPADDLGWPGWGITPADGGGLSPAAAAYYPAARRRFGFHDPLDGLAGHTGTLSYLVVGWYADQEHDPLRQSDDRQTLLRRWRWGFPGDRRRFKQLRPPLTSAAADSRFIPRSLRTQSGRSRVRTTTGRAPDLDRIAQQRSDILLSKVVGLAQESGNTLAKLSFGTVPYPTAITCHGAVVGVPLSGSSTVTAQALAKPPAVHPTVRRAAAAVASLDPGDQDITEALLEELDYLAGSKAGTLDLPYVLHARSFQSAPGKGRWYARLELSQRRSFIGPVDEIDIGPIGRWPIRGLRNASKATKSTRFAAWRPDIIDRLAGGSDSTRATGPSQAEVEAQVDTLMQDLADYLAQTVAEAAADGRAVDPQRLFVRDHRDHATSPNMGADGDGSSGAGFWLDIQDRNAVREVLIGARGARIEMPGRSDLHSLPGPRWYRPFSPRVVFEDAGRSYRFGGDGRFDQTGGDSLRCRFGGDTVSAIHIPGNHRVPVYGHELLDDAEELSEDPDLPASTRGLAEETNLLDPANADRMMRIARARNSAIRGANLRSQTGKLAEVIQMTWLRRTRLSSQQLEAAGDAVGPIGDLPSPLAITPWADPWNPIFADLGYSFQHSPLASQWRLDVDNGHPELLPLGPGQAVATDTQQIAQRVLTSTTVVQVLQSAIIGKMTLDKYGNLIPAHPAPAGVDADSFEKLEILSAPLTDFDQELAARGLRERGGALLLQRTRVVDVFGTVRHWQGPQDPRARPPSQPPRWPYWTPLPPRLPFWARLPLRLIDAEPMVDGADADAEHPPVAGFLLPDLIEHALEVYDASGEGLGQLRADSQPGRAAFEPHPWVAAERGLPPGNDPLSVIDNQHLRALVAGIAAQPGEGQGESEESGLIAMLRVMDTVRATVQNQPVDPSLAPRLIGQPIAVLRARLSFETADVSELGELAASPATQPDATPIRVHIGDINRPDDGVLGLFLPAATAADARFAPVSAEAAEEAITNGLASGRAVGSSPATHRFVTDQPVSAVTLQADQPRELTLLVDLRGNIYANCGVLPRKRITLPREQVAPGLSALQPSFAVGPLLTLPRRASSHPILPTPELPGYAPQWLRADPDSPHGYDETPAPRLPPIAELPIDRVALNAGWLRYRRED